MILKHRTKGFVFKKSDRNESDRVFSVFTEDYGRVEILGKGIRKINSKLRAGIDLFFLSEIEFIQGKNHKTLTDARKVEKFCNLAQNPEKFGIAGKISEILENFIKGEEKDEAAFSLLGETFGKLDNFQFSAYNSQLLYYYFFWNFISSQGYRCQVRRCACCSSGLKPHDIYFSPKEGGIICGNCFQKEKTALKVNADAVKVLRVILEKEWRILPRLKMEDSSYGLLAEISKSALDSFCPS